MDNKKLDFIKDERQLELIKKYYDVDIENKIINITLHYDKASDILDITAANKKSPLFLHEPLEKINNLISNAPFGYKLAINFEIDDYEGYDPKNIISSFNDTLELSQYAARKHRQFKQLLSATLVLIGVLLLFFMVVSKNLMWFGNGIKAEIINEVINITAWVFVWEAVTLLFLEHSEEVKFALKIRRGVFQIAMYKTGDEQPLAKEKALDVFGKWENEGNLKRAGKYFLLISSMALIFMAFYNSFTFMSNLKNMQNNHIGMFAFITISISITSICAGIGGLAIYVGKKNSRFSRLAKIFSLLFLIFIICILAVSIALGNMEIIISISTTLLIDVCYCIGVYIERE